MTTGKTLTETLITLRNRSLSAWENAVSTCRETATLALVETMPEWLVSSHLAAGNWGYYPHNGAERRWVSEREAEEIVAADPHGYAHIVHTHCPKGDACAEAMGEAMAAWGAAIDDADGDRQCLLWVLDRLDLARGLADEWGGDADEQEAIDLVREAMGDGA